jgi:hypothetical protein
MERMGMDLQKKVIVLQQEKDSLEERLMRGAPLNLTAEVERRQNLELKVSGSLPEQRDINNYYVAYVIFNNFLYAFS